jgi:aminopeptidase N
MIQKFIYTVFALTCFSATVGAHNGNLCAAAKKKKLPMKTTAGSYLENNYDVKYLKFNLNLTNTSTQLSGDVTIKALTVNLLDTFAFELNSVLTVDSVLFNGINEPFTTNGSIRKVPLSSVYNIGVAVTAQVFYHGQPPTGTGQFFTGGLSHVKMTGTGTNIMYSISDPDLADDWWPCKQSITDKIDSMDMWLTVADSLKAGSNGVLKNITSIPGSKLRYEWKTIYPIDYYLISVAVAPYTDYSYFMHFTDGSGDSMLVQNYVYDSAVNLTQPKRDILDSTGLTIDHFSKLFGRYPFHKEKYGHCYASPLGGGMEHQTMTTLGSITSTLIAHELGHQWWGNHVTYGSWRDIWVSEGFATYCEQLFVEQFRGVAAAQAYRTSVFNVALNGIGGSVYVDDTMNVNRIFDYRLTYNKGGSVAHMLRYVAPADSLYFKAMRAYQQQFAYGNAVTGDLHTVCEQVYGKDLDTFFNQWIYGEGYPTYSAKWYQLGTQAYIQITQTASKPSTTPLFSMPLELKLKSATGDTTVKIYNDAAKATYPMPWSQTMTGLEIDPNNHVLNKTGTIAQDVEALYVQDRDADYVKIYPNPARDVWHIAHIPVGAGLELKDITGKTVWTFTGNYNEIIIPANNLPNGTYILNISLPGNIVKHYKLVK